MKKKLLSLLGMLMLSAAALPPSCHAEEFETAVVVSTKDGEQIRIAVDKHPQISFTETDLLLTTTEINLSYPIDSSLKLSFGDISGISDEKIHTAEFKITRSSLDASGLKPYSKACIYSLNGSMVANGMTDSNGCWHADLDILPQGIYIIKCNETTYKMILK